MNRFSDNIRSSVPGGRAIAAAGGLGSSARFGPATVTTGHLGSQLDPKRAGSGWPFACDRLKAGLEGDAAAEKLLGQATGRTFVSTGKASSSPVAFHAFRGALEPLDSPRDEKNMERLAWDVRRGMSAIKNHPWLPSSGPDAVTVRGFIYDVDTGKLEEVSYPGPMGSIG